MIVVCNSIEFTIIEKRSPTGMWGHSDVGLDMVLYMFRNVCRFFRRGHPETSIKRYNIIVTVAQKIGYSIIATTNMTFSFWTIKRPTQLTNGGPLGHRMTSIEPF